ncbi:hypothetical protein LINPERHAP2_LOCUS31922 [Linum perenne]
MDHHSSKSTKSTILIITLLAISTLVLVLVESKGADISIIRAPICTGKSKNNGYNKSVEKLLGTLVNETKSMHRETIHQAYRYTCKIPDSEPGSVAGTATCSGDLGKSECWGCLVHAQGKLVSGCDDPVKASVKLQDCSIWFDRIC